MNAEKLKSAEHSGEQLTILNMHWNNGLRATKTPADKARVADVAAETGLSKQQVKSWIHNRNAAERRRTNPVSKDLALRKVTGYAVYSRPFLSNSVYGNRAQRMKRAAAEWRQLDDCTRKLYTEKAAEENGSRPFNIDDLDEIAKKRWIKRQIKELQATCSRLESAGVQTAAILVHEATLTVYNVKSTKGDILLHGEAGLAAEDEFAKMCSNAGGEMQKTHSTVLDLRRAVQTIFNDKYSEGTKKPGSRLPYQHMSDLIVVGLPPGIAFRKPSSYGVRKLQSIIDVKDAISITATSDIPGRQQREQSAVDSNTMMTSTIPLVNCSTSAPPTGSLIATVSPAVTLPSYSTFSAAQIVPATVTIKLMDNDTQNHQSLPTFQTLHTSPQLPLPVSLNSNSLHQTNDHPLPGLHEIQTHIQHQNPLLYTNQSVAQSSQQLQPVLHTPQSTTPCYKPLPLYSSQLEGLPPLENMTCQHLREACQRLKIPSSMRTKIKLFAAVQPYYCRL